MLRHPSLFAGASLLALACAAPALAQIAGTGGSTGASSSSSAGGLVARPLRVGGEDVKMGVIPVGIKECTENADIEFELDGVPMDKSVDVYLGEACNQPTSRDNDTNSNCEFVDNFEGGVTRQLSIVIKASQLIGGDCSSDEESKPKIWFLAVNSSKSNEEVKEQYTYLENLRLDTRAPKPPTGVEGGSGEKQIPVEWDATGADLEGFVVLIDSNPTDGSGGGASGSGASDAGGASGSSGADEDGGLDDPGDEPKPTGGGRSSDGECGSSILTPGGSFEGLPSRIKRKTINEATATGIDLSPNDIDGDSAAIAVVAVDEAGNESALSDLACVKIVPTDGFWDRYQKQDNAVDGGCPCAALGPAQIESAWPIGLALALIARSARRRRRS